MTELLYARSWDLDDIEILRAADGHSDGRTVTAYAAVFDIPAEIRDQHGHYMEQIDRRAFNRQIGLGVERVSVLYNHGLTAHGTPSGGLGSIPIGSPVEIKADSKGLRTVTRFNRSEMSDHVLEAIRNGDIRGYSFRGRIFKSNPEGRPKMTRSGGLPTVTRTELGLTEYGPTFSPAYADAGILAIRTAFDTLLQQGMSADEILRKLASTTPEEAQETHTATSTSEPGELTDQPDASGSAQRAAHSRVQQLQLSLQARLRDRGLN